MSHKIYSWAWFIFAIVIIFTKGAEPMFYTALICSTVWAATEG